MPTVVASAAVVVALGLAWRFVRRPSRGDDAAPQEGRAPTEIADAVPLVRDADGVYRPSIGGE